MAEFRAGVYDLLQLPLARVGDGVLVTVVTYARDVQSGPGHRTSKEEEGGGGNVLEGAPGTGGGRWW